MSLIQEHSIQIRVDLPQKDVSAQMDVFYNPIMVSNRNISILLLNCLEKKELKMADPLAGSGIRSLRFLKELKKDKITHLFVNDMKETFPLVFAENLHLNHLSKDERVTVSAQDASVFLLSKIGFDYIDIDPFGSPNPFLAAAIGRISREGILAVTSTDTAALTGTYPKATLRKYWASSFKNYLMHELGLRILIRKVQLQGVQFDKALVPILSYHKDHYFRIYFCSFKGKEKCDELIQQLRYFLFCTQCLSFKTSTYNKEKCSCGKEFIFAGPLWVGKLFDAALIGKMAQENPFPEEQKFLDILKEEAKIDVVGFYDLHALAHKLKKEPPKMEKALRTVKGVRTQFSLNGIKTKETLEKIKDLF